VCLFSADAWQKELKMQEQLHDQQQVNTKRERDVSRANITPQHRGVTNDPETFSYVMNVCSHENQSNILIKGLFWDHHRTTGLKVFDSHDGLGRRT